MRSQNFDDNPSINEITPTPDTEMNDAGALSKSHAKQPTEHVDRDPFVEYLSIISEWHKKSREIIKYITTMPNTPPAEQSSTSTIPSPNSSPSLSCHEDFL